MGRKHEPIDSGSRCSARFRSCDAATRAPANEGRMREFRVPSCREASALGCRLPEKCDRLETVIAGAAGPEIGGAAVVLLDPVGNGDRLAALCAGILLGQRAKTETGHDASPFERFFGHKQMGQNCCRDCCDIGYRFLRQQCVLKTAGVFYAGTWHEAIHQMVKPVTSLRGPDRLSAHACASRRACARGWSQCCRNRPSASRRHGRAACSRGFACAAA